MDETERMLKDLQEGHSVLMNVPLTFDIDLVADCMKLFGMEHGMNLSIVPMMTELDQKLAIGPGTPIAGPSYR